MGHGVGLLAQVQQGAGDATGDVQERQVADLAGGGAQASGDLRGYREQDLGVLAGQLAEFGVADLRHLALGFRFHPGGTGRIGLEQAHLTEEVAFIQVGHDHLTAIVVLDHHRHGALEDVVQGVRLVTGVDDGALGRVLSAMTVGEKLVQIWNYLVTVAHGLSASGHAA